MTNEKKLFKRTLSLHIILIIFILMMLPAAGIGGEVTLIPSISAKGEYNDNITFLRENEIEDYIGTISPALTFDYATPRTDLYSKAKVDVMRYSDESDLNTENQHYEFHGTYKALERLELSGQFSFIKDTTLESELEETGLVGVRSDRDRWTAGGGFSYKIDQLSDVGLEYSHNDTSYDWPANNDYDYDLLVFSYNHKMKNERDVFTIQPYYMDTDSKITEAKNYALTVGWVHAFTETVRLSAFLGPRYTKIKYFFLTRTERDSEWGGVADISLRQNGETLFWTAGYNQELIYNSTGDPIDRKKLYGETGLMITSRFSIKFAGNLYFVESSGEFTRDVDRRYFTLKPSLKYNITENHSLVCAYDYSHDYDKNAIRDDTKDRHRIWVSLNFNFPQKW